MSRDGICPIEASQLSPRWWVVCLFKTRIYAPRYQPLLKLDFLLESWYKQSDNCHITSAISLVSLCPIPFDNWGRNIFLLLWFVLLESDWYSNFLITYINNYFTWQIYKRWQEVIINMRWHYTLYNIRYDKNWYAIWPILLIPPHCWWGESLLPYYDSLWTIDDTTSGLLHSDKKWKNRHNIFSFIFYMNECI